MKLAKTVRKKKKKEISGTLRKKKERERLVIRKRIHADSVRMLTPITAPILIIFLITRQFNKYGALMVH